MGKRYSVPLLIITASHNTSVSHLEAYRRRVGGISAVECGPSTIDGGRGDTKRRMGSPRDCKTDSFEADDDRVYS
jgi:hypothetical protein